MKSLCEVSRSAADVGATLLNAAVSGSDKCARRALSCLALMF